MPFELKLALRYLFSNRKGLVRFTSLVAVLGITVGVAGLIVAQAIAKGFSDEMRDKVLKNTAHITILDEGGTRTFDWSIIKRTVEAIENVDLVEPTSYESAVLLSEKASGYAVIRVFDDQSLKTADYVQTDQVRVSVGKELLKKLQLEVGDNAEVTVLGDKQSPKIVDVHIIGTFETGLYEYDSTWIYISQNEYLRLKNIDKFSPTVFSVSVKDIFRSGETSEQIKKVLGGNYKVLGWQEANKPLFAALSLERKVAFAIISLIIFIAALNITTTLALLINERKFDISILRTCGAKTKSLIAIFLFEGMILSISGIFLGFCLGIFFCLSGNYFELINISKEVYSLNYIPFHTGFVSIIQVVLVTFFLCLIAIAYPVLKVSRIKPLEILRTG